MYFSFKHPFFILIIVAGIAAGARAQNVSLAGRLSYRQNVHDFGLIHEGPDVHWDFVFTNTGTDSLRLTSVHAECGCTTPSFSHKPVAPGQQGKVAITYHTNHNPGPFEKQVIIATDGFPAILRVTIRGNVLPKPLTGTDVTLIGGIRFSAGTISLGEVPKGGEARYILHFQNASPHPIRILKLLHPPDLQAYYPPFTVMTGERMRVTMTFSPGRNRLYGPLRDSLIFKTNDTSQPDKRIYFTATVVSARKITFKSDRGPSLVFQKKVIDLGTVLQHDTVSGRFPFVNTGADTLIIGNVRTSCGCTIARLGKRRYTPGESGNIGVSFDAGEKFGDIRKTITVSSNDRRRPQVRLILRAHVVEHPKASGDSMPAMSAGESIFKGTCRNCHVNKGLGKRGRALFAADCQVCHGPAGKRDSVFHPGPALDRAFLSTFDGGLLFRRIAQGTPDIRKRQMMPGFSKKYGGPLSQEQVRSLVSYLQNIQLSQ